MTFNEYQQEAEKTAIYPEYYMTIYPALKLAGEAGEVAEKVGKRLRDHDGNLHDPEFVRDMVKELGDVLWYVSALASDIGVNLGIVASTNLEKLASRQARGVLGGSGDNR